MATITETIERDGKTIHVYDNGMERDANTGRIVKPSQANLITAENANEYHRARQEKKYERAKAGANRALTALRNKKFEGGRWIDDGPAWEMPEELDFVEAITEAQTAQALLVGDPSSTKAAEFVMRHTGYDERQEKAAQASEAIDSLTDLVREIAGALRERTIQPVQVIDMRMDNEQDKA